MASKRDVEVSEENGLQDSGEGIGVLEEKQRPPVYQQKPLTRDRILPIEGDVLVDNSSVTDRETKSDAKRFQVFADGISIGPLSLRLSNIPINLKRILGVGSRIAAWGHALLLLRPVSAQPEQDPPLCPGEHSNSYWQAPNSSQYRLAIYNAAERVNQLAREQMIPMRNPTTLLEKAAVQLGSECGAVSVSASDSYHQIIDRVKDRTLGLSCSLSELTLRSQDVGDRKFEECVAGVMHRAVSQPLRAGVHQAAVAGLTSKPAPLWIWIVALTPTAVLGGIIAYFVLMPDRRIPLPVPVNTSNHDRLEAIGRADDVPDDFCCPITRLIMNDPVRVDSGKIYERHAIVAYMRDRLSAFPDLPLRDLLTNQPISIKMTPVNLLREEIANYVAEQEAAAAPPVSPSQ